MLDYPAAVVIAPQRFQEAKLHRISRSKNACRQESAHPQLCHHRCLSHSCSKRSTRQLLATSAAICWCSYRGWGTCWPWPRGFANTWRAKAAGGGWCLCFTLACPSRSKTRYSTTSPPAVCAECCLMGSRHYTHTVPFFSALL